MDGGKSQLSHTLAEFMMVAMDEVKSVVNKNSDARIFFKQPCDLSPVFCLFKALSMSITRSDMPDFGLLCNMNQIFRDWMHSNILNMYSIKESALKDFLVSYPDIVTKAAPTETIACRFHLNGMIYKKTNSCLGLDSILKTCTSATIYSTQEILLYDSFELMYREFMHVDRFTNNLLHSIGLLKDIKFDGNKVSHPSEWVQYM